MITTAGAVNRSLYFYIQEDAGASNPGEPVTGLVFGNLDSASYARQGAARVAITLATLGSASVAHSDGGFILVDDTNMPGLYRLDVPDAAFLTGVDQLVVQIDPGAARVCAPVLVDVTDVDLRDSVRAGMTALPNAAADAAAGLPISDLGGLDLDAILADTNELQSNDVPGLIAALNDPAVSAIADAVWDEAVAGHVAAGSFGKTDADILADTNELQGDWVNGGRLDLLLDAIPTTAMRGTDGALTDKAGFSLSTAGILAVWHQALTAIITAGSVGKLLKDEITSARMAVLTDWINGGRLDLLLDAIPTTAMRGTDSAALASVATEARLAELDAANLPTDIAAIPTTAMRGTDGANTTTPLTAAQVNAEVDTALNSAIPGSPTADSINEIVQNLGPSASTLVTGTATGTPTTTTMAASALTEATDDHYNGRILIWTSGVLKDQATDITDYAGSTKTFTFTATTEAAAAGDTFVIV